VFGDAAEGLANPTANESRSGTNERLDLGRFIASFSYAIFPKTERKSGKSVRLE
jgi:hypothetical protein